MQLITLKTFDKVIDAHILGSKLESEGIESFLFDENMVAINPLYNLTLGGIKLKVKDEDMDRACMLLKELDSIPFTDNKEEIITCPYCSSAEVYNGITTIETSQGGIWKGVVVVYLSIVSILLFAAPWFMYTYKNAYSCKKCKKEFKGNTKREL